MSNKKNDKAVYQLTMNAEQAQTCIEALDLYSRVLSLQLQDVVYRLRVCSNRKLFDDDVLDYMDETMRNIQGSIAPIRTQRPRESLVAYNVYQALRYAKAKHNHPEGGITVDFGEPIDIGDVGIPEVSVTEGTGNEEL